MIEYDLIEEGIWDEVLRVAELRHKGKENLKTTRMYTSGNPNIIGCAGEMAFELATGLPMDRGQLMHGDEGWDFILPAHTHQSYLALVDVKTRSVTLGWKGEPKFFLKEKDLEKDCDLFVFVLMDRTSDFQPLPTVRIAGFISQACAQEVAKGRTKGYEITWELKLSQIWPIEELFTLDTNGGVIWT